MKMNNFSLNFFKNKKILITGHTGFKGSWLANSLITVNAQLIGISSKNFSNEPSLLEQTNIKKRIINYDFDLSQNIIKLNSVLQKHKPEYIFNLAAQSLVKKSINSPHETIRNNVLINLNLLECLRNIRFNSTILFITSDKVYENFELSRGYREDDILGGKDPYSASKSSSEIIISSYFQTFLQNKKNIKIGIARAGNVIGGGDWSKDRIIPDVMRSIKKNNDIIIRNPKSTRPWQHVLEPIFGYMYFAYILKKINLLMDLLLTLDLNLKIQKEKQ